MSLLLWVLAFLSLLCESAQLTASQDSSRQLIEKAVQAMGGLDKLTQGEGAIRKVKGKFPEQSFVGQTWTQGEDLLKLESQWTMNNKGKTDNRFLLLKKGKGWLSLDGQLITLDANEMAEFQRARHADKVAALVTLLKNPGYTLTTLGESKVKDQTVLGVKVECKGQPDVHLFFDKESGLLVKTWQKFKNSVGGFGGDFTVHENYFSNYTVLDPVAHDKELLKNAKLPGDGPALLKWVAGRTLTPQHRAKIAGLIKDLGSASFAVRTKATAELKKFGPEAAPLLEKALHAADSEVVLRAQQCLDHYAKDPATQQLPAALRIIAFSKPAGAAAVLLEYLPDAPSVAIAAEVQAALYDLAQTAKPDPVLLKALTDADPMRRAAAAAALGKDGGTYAKQPGRRLLFEGLKLAAHTELYRNGKLDLEVDTLEVRVFNALDEKLFVLPD